MNDRDLSVKSSAIRLRACRSLTSSQLPSWRPRNWNPCSRFVPRFRAIVLATLLGMAGQVAAELKIGDPAPALEQGKYIQGEPVTKFEAGKVYVVEFWATWCGPCRTSIPHLNDLQEKYKDQGVVIIGQDVWERGEMVETKVTDFVKQMGAKMGYRVALDTAASQAGAMAEKWMRAAGQNGIPTAFVVNQAGKIAWIGHPMSGLDEVVGQVLTGQFDAQAAARVQAAARAQAKAATPVPKRPGVRNAKDKLDALALLVASGRPPDWMPKAGLMAHYPLEDDLSDRVVPNRALQSKNANIVGRALYLNGVYEHSGEEGGYRLKAPIPELNYAAFTVALEFWPIDFGRNDVVFMGGGSYRWFGAALGPDGTLSITANNARVRLPTGVKVTAQRWHRLVCSVDIETRRVLVSFDGKDLPELKLPNDFKLDVIGSDAEKRDQEICFTDYSCGAVSHGFVRQLRVYGRALPATEMPRN